MRATLRGEPEGQALAGPGLAALLERGVVQLLVESQVSVIAAASDGDGT
ncbi:MAG TPA: hypothetical protein VMK12_13365 [Anaeromyxobacteraceae bacterium]|nr:hypothetical protein [Anaeromyxobacteraceae bacterium]